MITLHFHSYLQARQAVFIVQGVQSVSFEIANQVFQGTVLGPPLWNVFFADVDDYVCVGGFTCNKFADDLTAGKPYDVQVSQEDVLADLQQCQVRTHG